MPTDMNIGPDYQSRLAAQNTQQVQDAARQAEINKQPELKGQEPAVDENPLTREEVQGLVNSLVESIKSMTTLFATKSDIQNIPGNIIRLINGLGYIKEQQARDIAEAAIPASLRGLDSDARRKTGNALELVSTPNGDVASWVTKKEVGISAKGDKVLYKGIFLREYDEDGVIVAAGSDINPADYATQALYEAALTAAGHSLKYTNDWDRTGTDITP